MKITCATCCFISCCIARHKMFLNFSISIQWTTQNCTVKTTVFNKRNIILFLYFIIKQLEFYYLFTTLPAGFMLINNKLITL